ncbi:glycoside hydrolase, partial [Nostoc sp. 3335mG]
MNGNVSVEGAERDLRWMHTAGIGGVQLFEGALDTPRIIDPPALWGNPTWQSAIRRSATVAQSLGMDLAVASSPGWSATGAPFVQPADAMKKLVWSQGMAVGGKPVGRIAAPPTTPGPFQDVAAASSATRSWYADIAVLAFPAQDDELPAPTVRSGDGSVVQSGILHDARFAQGIEVPIGADGTAALYFDFGRRVPLGGLTVGLPARSGFGAPPPPVAILSVSDDGQTYRDVATLTPNPAQARAAGLGSLQARYAQLRIVMERGGGPPTPPGVVPLPVGPAPTSVTITEARFDAVPQVDRWIEKAGFATVPDYQAVATPADARGTLRSDAVVDVTRFLQPDGTLDWTPPPGKWTILRLGASLTGKTNGPAPAEATGLEIDKLDAATVERYADRYLDEYERAAGPGLVGRSGIRSLLSDSIEAGNQNWTPDMRAAFQRLRGYDPLRWFPALTGRIIDSAEATDRFLWDYRRTIADLLQDAHYGGLARAAHRRGMTYYAEALEDHRPQLGDDLAMRARADVPMGAFWWTDGPGRQRPTFVADLQGAASVANIYGKPIVGAESFTAFGRPWGFAPGDLKETADYAFALGVNRVMIHTSAHQPIENAAPGLALANLLGQYFTRNESWAGMARGWTDYLARCSWLLQQGRHAADFAWFIGEEAPVTALYGDKLFDGVPRGFGFDFVGPEGLADHLKPLPDGSLISTGGVRYRAVVVGSSSARMTLATVNRLRALVDGGATIVGTRPIASPSLADDPLAWRNAVDTVWPKDDKPVRTIGKGRVFARLRDLLAADNLRPDWETVASSAADLVVQHRLTADGDVWFLFNRGATAFRGDVSLRGSERRVSRWDAGE